MEMKDTHVQVGTLSYTWTIDDFFSLWGKIMGGMVVVSPIFSTGGAANYTEWCLKFGRKKKCILLKLQLVFSKKSAIHAKYIFVIKDQYGYAISKWDSKKLCTFKRGNSFGNKMTGILALKLAKKILISCEVVCDASKEFKDSQCTVCVDFKNLFLNERFCDVTLAAAGKEYRAHKAVLAARSVVFAAMFEHDMKERQQNRVDILDVDPDVLGEMLLFIYSGEAPSQYEITGDLLAVADKYALEELKLICEQQLCKNISVKTVVETLIFADLHRADELKAKTIRFINTNTADVIKTEGWQNMIVEYPLLLAEAYLGLASSVALNKISRRRAKQTSIAK